MSTNENIIQNTDKQAVIDVNQLSKRYHGSKEFALKNLSLEVKAGEVYGFLGANGAGKSTTIRLLLNFIQPTSGSATIIGKDVVRESVDVMHEVGYLAGDVALYNKMTGKKFLDYMSELHPLEHTTYLRQLVSDFKAEIYKKISDLSKGNRQKIGIIQAFMHEPKVLILDEPTSGLDPLMQEVFFEHIRLAKNRGACVFFSSHNLAEVQRVCDRIGFIHKGRLIKEQSLAELAHSSAHTFDLIFSGSVPLLELRRISAVHTHDKNSNIVSLSVPANKLPMFFSILARSRISHFQQREVNLEEEFMNLYRGADNDKK
jgi:ABC-2 type transport system ATP-binding protein